jgi:hypothetical protein
MATTSILLHGFGVEATHRYFPRAGVIMDAKGNPYGTGYLGGVSGLGAVFKLVP